MRVDGNVLDSGACLFPTTDFHMKTALVHCCMQAHKHTGSSRPPSSPEARHSERSTAATAYVLSAVLVRVCLTPSSFSQRLKDESALLNHTS